MSDTLTSDATEAAAAAPEYPMERSGQCPFAPPPEVMALAAVRAPEPGPDLGRQHPVADHRLRGSPRAVRRRPGQRQRPHPGFPHWNEAMLAMVEKRPRSVFNADAEEHTFYRRMLSKPFTFKRVEGLRPAIQKITDDHIDAILAGPKPAELVSALALPVPSLVICEMLGVPYEDHGFFQEHANVGLARYATAEDNMKGVMSLGKYLQNLVESKMTNPAEDAVSDLAERVSAGEITVKEAAQLASGLLIAGHETTANMIGIGVLALLENPEQLAILRDTDDPKVVANAVEELLRYLSIIQNGQRRAATEDIEIGGRDDQGRRGHHHRPVPGGLGSEEVPGPGRSRGAARQRRSAPGLRLRPPPVRGQQLARAELQIVFTTLLRRIPTLALAKPIDEIPFKNDKLAYGVYELPVTW